MNVRLIGIGGIISIGLAAIALLTNPEQQDYRKYASQTINVRLKEFCQSERIETGWLQNHCYTLVDTARPYLAAAIDTHTLRYNFVLFSIYQTNLPIPASVANYQIETIGIFNIFFTYKAEEL